LPEFTELSNFAKNMARVNLPLKSPQPPFKKGGLGGFLELAGCKNQPFGPGVAGIFMQPSGFICVHPRPI
jgi:hypothetical protein